MPQITFTEAQVRGLRQQPKTTWYTHAGDAYPGLHLAVGQSSKTWYLKKRNPMTGKTMTVNLGRYPAVSLELAANESKKRAAEIHNGTVASAEKMDTLRHAFEYHVSTKLSADKIKASTVRDYRSAMKNVDAIMDRKLESISHMELQRLLSSLSPPTARLCRAVIGASYRQARKHRPDLNNPAEGIELKAATKREPITKGDLSAIWKDMEQLPSHTERMAWIVVMLTGIRNSAVAQLRWTRDPKGERGHVELNKRVIHLPRMKNRLSRDIPISSLVVAALTAQKGKDPINVFPSEVRVGVPIHRLRSLPSSRVHDTRHHYTTACGKRQLPSYIIAFLRGDKINADAHQMVAHYMGDVADGEIVEQVTSTLVDQYGTTPDSALELIQSGT